MKNDIRINGVQLEVEWHIDVDSPTIDSVCVSDTADDIHSLLGPQPLSMIRSMMQHCMCEVAREKKAWKGQYYNVR